MSNDFFNFTVPLVRKTTARAEPLNTLWTAVQTGFGLFPSKARIYEQRINFCGADTGNVNAYVVTAPYTITLTDGLRLVWRPAVVNTGASVLNANALGNVAVTNYAGTALSGGELAAGASVETIYHATANQHRILNPLVAIGTVSVTNKVKAAVGDTTPGNLEDKITGSGCAISVTAPTGDAKILITVTPPDEGQTALLADLFS